LNKLLAHSFNGCHTHTHSFANFSVFITFITEQQNLRSFVDTHGNLAFASDIQELLALLFIQLDAMFGHRSDPRTFLLIYLKSSLPLKFNVADYHLERDRGNLKTALPSITAAITIIENLRTKSASPELRASYFATVEDSYEFYIDLLMQLHQKDSSKGFDAQAFHARNPDDPSPYSWAYSALQLCLYWTQHDEHYRIYLVALLLRTTT